MEIFFLIFSGVFLFASAQYSDDLGSCIHHCVNPEANITNEKLEGIWYLQLSIPHFFDINMKCSMLNVSEAEDKLLDYYKSDFNNETGDIRETFGTIEYTDDGFTVFFATELELPFDYETIELTPDFWVLVICSDCGFYEKKSAGTHVYIFTRLQYPSCEILEEAIKVVTSCNIPRESLIEHDQNDCSYCE